MDDYLRDFLFVLALNRIFINKPEIASDLLTRYKFPGEIFSKSNPSLKEFLSSAPNYPGKIAAFSDWKSCEAELKEIKEKKYRLITFGSDSYPERLMNIDSPPPMLMLKGKELSIESSPCVAIVGSRKATEFSLEMATNMGFTLAKNGVTIISGMAYGIDAAAHWGCLRAGGTTIAVLGTGLDIVYPASHKNLAEEIERNGTLVSEFPLGTKPMSYNFPRRNRIISGLADLVIIVEATKRSGSLITARYALEQGRDIGVVPARAGAVFASGSNNLLRQGAHLIESIDDILNLLSWKKSGQGGGVPVTEPDQNSNDKNEKVLSLDEMVQMSGMPIDLVQSAVTMMVVEGRLKELPGKRYTLSEVR